MMKRYIGSVLFGLLLGTFGILHAQQQIGGGAPGGSNTQLQYNKNGALGGDTNLTWDNVGLTLTTNNLAIIGTCTGCTTSPAGANTQVQYNSSGSFGASANFTFTVGTGALSVPKVSVTGIGGLTFNGNSPATSVLILSGTSAVAAAGAGLTFVSPTLTIGVNGTTTGDLALANGAGGGAKWTLESAATTGWKLTSAAVAPAQGDLFTFSNATGQMSSVVDVATGQVVVSGGVGAAPSYSATPSVTSVTMTSSGTIGVIGTTQGVLTLASSAATSSVKAQAAADGILTLLNNAGTGFSRLQLGGTTASFPAFKQSGATVVADLADDSAEAAFGALCIDTANAVPSCSGGNVKVPNGGLFIFNQFGILSSGGDGLIEISDNATTHKIQINSGNAPVTLGACGTGTLTTGSRPSAGEVTMTGSTTCVINFGTNFTNTPAAIILTDQTVLGGARVTARSNSSFTITATAADVVDWWIPGYK